MQEASTRKIYDVQSLVYDYTFGALVTKRIGRAIEHMKIQPGETVLDVGIGTGGSLPYYPKHAKVLGVDLSSGMLREARKKIVEESRYDNITVFQGNALELPFEDSSFDLVLCLEVLEHIPDPAPALKELARVCRGDLVLSVPSEPWFRLGSLARGKYMSGWGNHPEHVNHWNLRSFREFLAARTEVVSVERSTPWIVAHARPSG